MNKIKEDCKAVKIDLQSLSSKDNPVIFSHSIVASGRIDMDAFIIWYESPDGRYDKEVDARIEPVKVTVVGREFDGTEILGDEELQYRSPKFTGDRWFNFDTDFESFVEFAELEIKKLSAKIEIERSRQIGLKRKETHYHLRCAGKAEKETIALENGIEKTEFGISCDKKIKQAEQFIASYKSTT